MTWVRNLTHTVSRNNEQRLVKVYPVSLQGCDLFWILYFWLFLSSEYPATLCLYFATENTVLKSVRESFSKESR